MPEQDEGWIYTFHSVRFHYYRNRVSLCGMQRLKSEVMPPIRSKVTPKEDVCYGCAIERRAEEQLHAPAPAGAQEGKQT